MQPFFVRLIATTAKGRMGCVPHEGQECKTTLYGGKPRKLVFVQRQQGPRLRSELCFAANAGRLIVFQELLAAMVEAS